MRVTGPNLSVAVQKQALVVCDPVKHLPERKRQPESLQEKETTDRNSGTGPNAEKATFSLDNLSRILDFSEVSTVLNLQDL